MKSSYKKIKEELLANPDYDCRQFFCKNGYILENGYAEILFGNLEEAKKIFLMIKEKDIRACWALILISLIQGDIREYPTYFQLRNFLEIDLNILIKHFKGNYVENIVRYSDFLFSINPEVYKFIGRVFYNNGLNEHALYFLKTARNNFYNDPELHYLLGYMYYNNKETENSKKALNDCLNILPKYFPAINLLNKIKKSL